MTGQPSCDVVGCVHTPTGSYLAAGPAGATEFVVCQAHLAKMQAGRRPVVVKAKSDASGPAARSSLLLD